MLSMLLRQRDGALIDQLLRHPSVPPEARAYFLRKRLVFGEWRLAQVATIVASFKEAKSWA